MVTCFLSGVTACAWIGTALGCGACLSLEIGAHRRRTGARDADGQADGRAHGAEIEDGAEVRAYWWTGCLSARHTGGATIRQRRRLDRRGRHGRTARRSGRRRDSRAYWRTACAWIGAAHWRGACLSLEIGAHRRRTGARRGRTGRQAYGRRGDRDGAEVRALTGGRLARQRQRTDGKRETMSSGKNAN